MEISPKKKAVFRKTVQNYYRKNRRDALPWRKKITPYRIWISEVMLQQTQVDRVVPFFNAWMKAFPSIRALANAPQSDVLRLWKGLGYNSRAIRLKRAAETMVKEYGGKFPKDYEKILKLPGIGPYTAGAICAFAYDQSQVIIETNIRRVFIHHFFAYATNVRVHDRDILKLVRQTLPVQGIREWYWALMDYGSHLGRELKMNGKKFNPNTRSRHYTKQSKFAGSDRQIRGRILDILLIKKNITIETLLRELRALSDNHDRIEKIIDGLEREGFLKITTGKIFIA